MRPSLFLCGSLLFCLLGPGALAAKKTAKKQVRAPSSNTESRVFDENTSFEAMLENREERERRPAAFAVKARVIGIRRDIGLTDKEDDQAQRDIVLNMGRNAGLAKGMNLVVKRHIPILDPYRENLQRTLEIEFAQLRVVHVQDEVAIARIRKIEDIADGLAIGTRSVLLGDYVGTN